MQVSLGAGHGGRTNDWKRHAPGPTLRGTPTPGTEPNRKGSDRPTNVCFPPSGGRLGGGEFFLQFLVLLGKDEGGKPARFVRMAGSSTFADQKEKVIPMSRILITLTLLSSILLVQVNSSYGQMSQGNSSSQSVKFCSGTVQPAVPTSAGRNVDDR